MWLVLATWLGAWVLFAASVAPTAFRVLARDDAAALVGPILASLHRGAIGAGLALFALGWLTRARGLRLWLPLVLAAVCAVSEFGITAAIADLRSEVAEGADLGAEFAALHRASRALYGLVGLGLVAMVVSQTRADASSHAAKGESPH